ncbi:MAG: Fur family transcriptional regulator [Candidatus Gastranaerophilales bacterium]|nr:Fur family transcriptional regulator [Candidatus Gastranaerophilales bacterium]
MNTTKKIIDNLRKKGYRITSQREKILEIFLHLPDEYHLSAEDLQIILLQNNVKISLATLYRTLKFLASNGLLRELDFGEDHKHYEYNSANKPHHHLICLSCGLTTEFNDEKLLNCAKDAALNLSNFQVLDYQFKIFGLCANCQGKIKA